jgi:hypothetical protein
MVPELDNNGIDSYFMINVHPTGMTYEIQMNYDPFNDYLIIFKADPTNDIEDDY